LVSDLCPVAGQDRRRVCPAGDRFTTERLDLSPSGITWFGARVGMEGVLGFIVLVAAVLLLVGRERRAINIAYVALLFSITVVNLLLFYFDQFSTIINATVQFASCGVL
jgi:hypothetical protein